MSRDVRGEPIEPVKHGQRDVPGGVRGQVRRLEDGVASSAAPSSSSARSCSVSWARSGSNSWRTTPNEKVVSNSEPRELSTCVPASRARSRVSRISDVLPMPGGPRWRAVVPSRRRRSTTRRAPPARRLAREARPAPRSASLSSVSAAGTRRCCAPSCKSRSRASRASSDAATLRPRLVDLSACQSAGAQHVVKVETRRLAHCVTPPPESERRAGEKGGRSVSPPRDRCKKFVTSPISRRKV